ncbi:MAG: T9SS type A sorting domain-containing protein [Ignavibacteria bacterium]|nr:T9SS type A sorting domain-containing protein [Ignavibacteria bacterium]
MKKTILILLLLVISTSLTAQTIVVNEYFNGFVQKREFVELLVIQNNLDLRGMQIRDFSSAGSPQSPLYFTYNPYWNNLKSGLIILITLDTSLFIQDTNKSDYSICIKFNSQDTTYIRGTIFNIANASDAVQIRTVDTSHVHGLSHGTANQNSLPMPKAHWSSALSGGVNVGGASLYFTKSTIMSLSDFANNNCLAVDTSNGGTPGLPNDNAGNLQYILSLRQSSGIIKNSTLAEEFQLYQNYPNPFNPTTNIKFSIPTNGTVALKLYDILGNEVINIFNGYLNSGIYTINLNASNLPSGIYFCNLNFTNLNGTTFFDSKKLILTK